MVVRQVFLKGIPNSGWGNDRIVYFADNGGDRIDIPSNAGIVRRIGLTTTNGAGFAMIG